MNIEYLITVDRDPEIGYETNSTLKKVVNFFLIPVLNSLPAGLQTLLKKTHKSAKEVIEHTTTHQALEVVYNKGYPERSQHLVHHLFHTIWFNTNNAKAVRNRLRLVKRELHDAISRLSRERRKIAILSIASGSARAVFEVLSQIQLGKDTELTATFLDKNSDAIEYSKRLAELYCSGKRMDFQWVNDRIENFFENQQTGNNKYNIVEVVGLVDYFKDKKAVQVFRTIYDHLADDGILITANINNNPERKFLTEAIGWEMIYRSGEQLASLVMNAGFGAENIKVFYEPLKIHCVLIASK